MVTTTTAQAIANTLADSFVQAGIRGDRAKFALRGRQGSRNTFDLTLPIGEVLDLVQTAGRIGDDTEDTNRVLMPDWVKQLVRNIRVMLLRGKDTKFILLPLTANVGVGEVRFNALSQSSSEEGGLADVGILTIPQSVKFSIADGQHRLKAYEILIKEFPWFAEQAVSLFVVEESDATQKQLDFATAGKTRPLTRTLLAYFDSSVAINAATKDTIEFSTLIKDQSIEKFKNGVSGKRNPRLWTFNQLVSFVGAGLAGGTFVQKTEALADAFDNQLSKDHWSPSGSEIVNYAKEMATCLDEFLSCNVGRRLVDALDRPDLVEDWNDLRGCSLIFKGVGINTLASLIYELRDRRKKLIDSGDISQSEGGDWLLAKVREIADLDWAPTADTFSGTLVRGTRVVSSTTAVFNATIIALGHLQLLEGHPLPRKTVDNLSAMMGDIDESTGMTVGEIKVNRQIKDSVRMARREG